MRKLSLEVVKQRLFDSGVIEYEPFVYTNVNEKIYYNCPNCKVRQFRVINSIFRKGAACRQCKINEYRYTQEDIERKLTDLGIKFKPFTYTSMTQFVSYPCSNCYDLKENRLDVLLEKQATTVCIKCKKKPERHSEENIKEYLKQSNIDYVDFKYTNTSQKIKHKCIQCNTEKLSTVQQLLTGSFQCVKCGNDTKTSSLKYSQQEIEAKLTELNFRFKPFNYANKRQKITFYCNKCDSEVINSISTILNRERNICTPCISDERRHSQEYIESQLSKFDLDFEPFSYKTANDKIIVKCIKCLKPTRTAISSLLIGKRLMCVECGNNASLMEERSIIVLNNRNISYEREFTFEWLKHKKNLYLDFYLPEYKVAIECQGRQHFEPEERFGGENGLIIQQQRDMAKKSLCEEYGIKLYYINYNEDTEAKLNEILQECGITNNEDSE